MHWKILLKQQAEAAYRATEELFDLVDDGTLAWKPESGTNRNADTDRHRGGSDGQREGRQFGVERAIFATVLHRLFESGSDRQGMRFLRDVNVPGSDDLELHHLHRAMHWLGEYKDEVEERLFAAHRDLFTQLRLVFFDTTSFCFEGEGARHWGNPVQGVCGKVFQAAGVAIPPSVRQADSPGAKNINRSP